MDSQKRWALLACAVAVAAMTGCMGGSSAPENPLAPYMPGGSDRAKLADNSDRSIVSPVFGSQTAAKPSTAKRMLSAVTDNPVTNTVSGAFKKSTNYLIPGSNSDASVDPVELAYKSQPPGGEVYTRLAELSENAGKLDQAANLYQKALDTEPDYVPALLGYAHLRDRQERLEEATQLYLQATQRTPDNASAHNDLGLCYARRGMLSESRASLERAVSLQPAKKLYRNNLATVLVELGQDEQAIAHLTAAWGPAAASHNLGVLLKDSGQPEKAREYFARALQYNPQLEVARRQLATLSPESASFQAPSNVPPSYAPVNRQSSADAPIARQAQQVAPNPTATPVYLQPYGSGTSPVQYGQPLPSNAPAPTTWTVPPQTPAGSPPSPGQYGTYQPSSSPRALPPVSGEAYSQPY